MAKGRTVLEQLNEDCKNAYFAGMPIIYVKTYETELMHDLIRMDEIVQRKMQSESGALVDFDDAQSDIVPWNYSEGLENRDIGARGAYCPKMSFPLEYDEWGNCMHLTLARGEELDIKENRSAAHNSNLVRLTEYVNAHLSAPENSALKKSVVIL